MCAACGHTCPSALATCPGCLLSFHPDPPCLAGCIWCVAAFCANCREPAAHKCTGEAPAEMVVSGESDIDRPSDQEEVEEEEEADITAVAVAEGDPSLWSKTEYPAAGLVRHWRQRTIHVRSSNEAGTQTACGFNLLVADYEALDAWPSVAWPLCRRAKCFEHALVKHLDAARAIVKSVCAKKQLWAGSCQGRRAGARCGGTPRKLGSFAAVQPRAVARQPADG